MKEFMTTVQAQMRLVSGIEIVNHVLSMTLIMSTTGVALWLWTQGQVGVGALAAAGAMALRLNGMSHWIMWEMAQLFEQVGTVQDGINTLSLPRRVVDRPDAQPLAVPRGEIRFDHVRFAYGAGPEVPPVIDDMTLTIRPGEKIGLVGRSGAGHSPVVNVRPRLYDPAARLTPVARQALPRAPQPRLRDRSGMDPRRTTRRRRSGGDNHLFGRRVAADEE